MSPKLNTIIQTIAFILLVVSSVSCANEPDTYAKICDIYTGIVNKPISVSEKEGLIAEGVMKSFPVFFDKEFSHIAQVDADKRYATLKQVIESISKKPWDCPIARKYYESELNQ
ncbi:MAG: hypothetical protein PVJ39_09330 [Gammaproteobacteria bacterium]|jgi:hypothetical protein